MSLHEAQPLEWICGPLSWWYSPEFSWVLLMEHSGAGPEARFSVVGGYSLEDFQDFFKKNASALMNVRFRLVSNRKDYYYSLAEWISRESTRDVEILDFYHRKNAETVVHLAQGKILLPEDTFIPVRVMIVDDSSSVRSVLEKMITQDPEFQVCATIEDPREVLKAIDEHKPDVITLDIHMPHLTGLDVLAQMSLRHPLPVIMVSAVSLEEGDWVFRCLEAGAIDYIQKPSLSEIHSVGPSLREKIRTASLVHPEKIRERFRGRSYARVGPQTGPAGVFRSAVGVSDSRLYTLNDPLIVMGASTGGTEALREVLEALPDAVPPILIVQHIPPVFSKAFADRLNQHCRFKVAEGEDGAVIRTQEAWVAPGGKQMRPKRWGNEFRLCVDDSPPVNRHQPSVDFLFNAVAELKPRKVLAILLTGMGADGAQGLLALRKIGAVTVAQDEKSCIVYGMPKAAVQLGAAEKVLPLNRIAEFALQWMEKARIS